ncbi:MAG: asparagine synthase (glutamine-hydrolyzing) [Pseudomonadota bacterium]
MCGIAGIVKLDGRAVEPRLLRAMNRAILHRGPDDGGYALIQQSSNRIRAFSSDQSPLEIKTRDPHIQNAVADGANVGFAHRRFAIIDLSIGGHQPIVLDDMCMTFNGEIYNYIELRQELENQGVVFQTDSDTEVMLRAYKHWGTDCFARFNGFWAAAIFDGRKQKVLLTRDRLGKKPLYYVRYGSNIYFASEIKSLLLVPEVAANKRQNDEAAWLWCAKGLRDVNGQTLFEDIHSLPAGSFVELDEQFPNVVNHFWTPPTERWSTKDISAEEAARKVRDTLQDAVSIRLRADVPLAIELSGGMDSSAVLALAASSHPEKLTTYTVKYPDPRWDEEPYARSVASRFNVDYRVVQPPMNVFWERIFPITFLEEEPFHSPNLHTSQIIWSMMRAQGIKVSLTGAAGDELFAGYGRYYPYAQRSHLKNLRFGDYIKNVVNWTERSTPIHKAWLKRMKLGGKRNLAKLAELAGLHKISQGPRFLTSEPTTKQPEPDGLSEMLFNDITNTLIPYWLRSGDKGSMSVPFEPRSPLLDYRVVELAMQMPESYLVKDGWHKWILRKAVEDILPPDVVWRRKKMGFPFPIESFYAEYKHVTGTILDRSNNPCIDLKFRDKLQHNWHAMSFILWYELFFNKNMTLFEDITRLVSGTQTPSVGFDPMFLETCGEASARNLL